MTEKESNKDQIWLTVFTVLPAVLLGNLGGDLSKTIGVNNILSSAILGGSGAMVGFGLNQLMKDRSTQLKVVVLLVFFVTIGVAARILLSDKTDEQLISEDWIIQKIGTISFESPTKLSLQTSKVPDGTELFYSSLEIFTDNNEERLTTFINAQILVDTLDLASSFGGSLEAMVTNIGVTEVELLDDHYMDSEKVIAKFTFQLNNVDVIGFGYMRLEGRILQSLWLMPIRKGYSLDYLDKFERGIEVE